MAPPTRTYLPSPPSLPLLQTATPTTPQLEDRDTVVTISVIASNSAATSAAPVKAKAFPIAVALPALLGGMALAVGGFGLWWWISNKRKKEKKEAWERRQRRNRKRAGSNATRPSMSSSRGHSGAGGGKAGGEEKDAIPAVPVLPKRYEGGGVGKGEARGEKEKAGVAYGAPSQAQQQQQQYQQYQNNRMYQNQREQQYQQQQQQQPQQPEMDERRNPNSNELHTFTTSTTQHYHEEPTSSAPIELAQPIDETPSVPSPSPSKGGRTAKRTAAAENAAASMSLDPNVRYQPKKPSPLALAAEQKAREAAEAARAGRVEGQGGWGEGPFRNPESASESTSPTSRTGRIQREEVLSEVSSGHHLQTPVEANFAQRQMSGEWGVALGSPAHDLHQGGFEYGNPSGAGGYANDPYLQKPAGSGGGGPEVRGKSGVYTEDPYADYHEEGVVDYHGVAGDLGLGSGAKSGRSNWV